MQPPVRWATPAPSDAAARPIGSAWWRRFGSDELDGLLRQGLSDNPTLQAAVARVRQAEGTAEIDGAPLWPSLDLVGNQDQRGGAKNSRTHEILGQAAYELDFWGRNRAAAASGEALAQATAFDAGTVAMTLSASVADTYFLALSLRDRVRLAQQIARDARHVLDLIQVQRGVGAATDLQVQQQETAVATFEAAVPALLQQMDVARHALAVLVGQPPEGFRIDAGTLDGLIRPGLVPDLPPALLEQRPDVRAAEARLVGANFDIGVARAAFLPSLSLNAGLGVDAKSLSHFFPAHVLTDVGASVLQPLFQGGQLEGQLTVSRERQVELAATYRQTVLTAFQDVEDALSAIGHVSAEEEIETRAVAAAQKASDLAQLQFRLGSTDYLSVLTTQQSLYQTRDALLQLDLQHLQAIVALARALGGGFGDPQAVAAVHTPLSPSGDAS